MEHYQCKDAHPLVLRLAEAQQCGDQENQSSFYRGMTGWSEPVFSNYETVDVPVVSIVFSRF